MQIVKLESWNRYFYCPVSGRNLADDDLEQTNIPSFRGLWVHNFYDMPTVKCKALEKAWQARYKKHIEEDEDMGVDEVLEAFLKEYNQPNWVTFEVTTHGIACGPVCETVWYVLDLGTIEEEEVEPKQAFAGKGF